MLSPAKRERFGVVAPAELSAALNERPPAAVLVGLERGELERPLIDYVRENGFRAVRLDDRATLWIAPPRRSNLRGEEKASQEDAVDPR